jgi:hypothetical protein
MGIPLDPNRRFPAHPSGEILEEYALDRLPETLAAQVEEHFLLCHQCQDAVGETDEFVAALKVAASQPAPQRSLLPQLASLTSPVTVGALVVLAFVVVWTNPQVTSSPVAVSLSSLRGANSLSPAPAGKPLRLNIELPDLVKERHYRAEVVDAAGSPVWEGGVSEVDGKLAATMSKPLRNGVYWIRLYGADSELLREFGLSAK